LVAAIPKLANRKKKEKKSAHRKKKKRKNKKPKNKAQKKKEKLRLFAPHTNHNNTKIKELFFYRRKICLK
jgi:hypothetical protein